MPHPPLFWTLALFTDPRSAGDTAARIEADGWDGLIFPDNQNLWGDTFVSMTVAATRTERLLLDHGATNPATRHPAVMASAIANVGAISGSRAHLGLARGDSALAHIGGAPVPVATFAEYLRVVRRYLHREPVEFDTIDQWRLAPSATELGLLDAPPNSVLRWLPADLAPVPITVYASGPRMIAIAAEHADRICFGLGADETRLAWAIDLARATCERIGRDPATLTFSAGLSVGVSDDRDEARALVANIVASSARFSSMHGTVSGPVSDADRRIYEDIAHGYDMTQHGEHGSQIGHLTADFVDRFAIVGPADHCIERLGRLHELGLGSILIAPPLSATDPDAAARAYRALMTEVLPTVRAERAS